MSKPVKNINQTPTEATLKASLLEILKEKPISKITVKEICEKSDIYRSTFYAHYKSPEALLDAMQLEFIDNLLAFLKAYDQEHPYNIKDNAKAFLSYIKSQDSVLRVLLFLENDNKVYNLLADAFAKQFRYSTKKYDTPRREEYTPIFMSHGLIACVMHWINTNYATPVDELAELLLASLHKINMPNN